MKYYIGSAKFIDLKLLSSIGYQNIGTTLKMSCDLGCGQAMIALILQCLTVKVS